MHLTAASTDESPLAVHHDPRAGKYLVFGLGLEEFGICVLNVREIMAIRHTTAIPQTPAYVKGVINLRGKVIPVVDLRLKFGLPEIAYTPRTCIIVIQLRSATGPLLMGVVVDEVVEVLNVSAADIENTPDFGKGVVIPHLLGVAKIKGKVKILLDIEEALRNPEMPGPDGLVQ